MITWPHLVTVEHDGIGFCDRSLELNLLPRVFRGHSFKVLDERLFPISNVGIVWDINLAGIVLDCFAGLALMKHQVVKRLGIPSVLL